MTDARTAILYIMEQLNNWFDNYSETNEYIMDVVAYRIRDVPYIEIMNEYSKKKYKSLKSFYKHMTQCRYEGRRKDFSRPKCNPEDWISLADMATVIELERKNEVDVKGPDYILLFDKLAHLSVAEFRVRTSHIDGNSVVYQNDLKFLTNVESCRRRLENPEEGNDVADEIAQAGRRARTPEFINIINNMILQAVRGGDVEDVIGNMIRDFTGPKSITRKNYSCSICMNDVDKVILCTHDHNFCPDCLKKTYETMAYDTTIVPKLGCIAPRCDGDFNSEEIDYIPAKIFGRIRFKLLQKTELKESRVFRCPYCTYSTLEEPQFDYFQCYNMDCALKSCRTCKLVYHPEMTCEEAGKKSKRKIDYSFKVDSNLIRNCPKCDIQTLRTDGCSKMTCSCGAKFCWLCEKEVKGYDHYCGCGEYTTMSICPKCNKCKMYGTNLQKDIEIAKTKVDNDGDSIVSSKTG